MMQLLKSLHLLRGDAQRDGIKIRIDCGVSRHFISDIRLFTSWDEAVPNITFSTAAGVPITSRALATLKFIAMDTQVGRRVVEMEHAYFVSNQPHNLISVSQLTRQQTCAWASLDFINCTWGDGTRTVFKFSYDNR